MKFLGELCAGKNWGKGRVPLLNLFTVLGDLTGVGSVYHHLDQKLSWLASCVYHNMSLSIPIGIVSYEIIFCGYSFHNSIECPIP